MADDRTKAIAERQARAVAENPMVERVDGDAYYGCYRVGGQQGSVYQVTAALEQRRRGHCTCRDFAVNGLDTCKHLEAVRLLLSRSPEATAWREPLDLARADMAGRDVLVFDLETQRLFQDVGGRHNLHRLGLSLGVVQDLRTRSFTTYTENQADALADRLAAADLVVGYNVLNFDYPVLEGYGATRVYRAPTFDLMLAVQEELGFRIGLDALAKATLGKAKTGDGLQAVAWYRTGRLDLVEKYCRDDVAVTADLFLYGRQHGLLQALLRDGSVRRVKAVWQAAAAAAAV